MNNGVQQIKTFFSYALVRQLVVLCIIAAVFLLIRLHLPTPQYYLSGATDMKAVGEIFRNDILEFGGKKAYARFSEAIAGYGVLDQHGYAHTFGHELYAVEGEKGIVACDRNFALGCFHQFLGDAIADLGPSSVQRLYAACATVVGTKGVCQHGLGHGVLASFGYEPADLQSALDVCDSETESATYSGCQGGAFMEYNLRTIASAEETLRKRMPDEGNMYAPCDSVHAASVKICTFWLPQWWYFSVLQDSRQQGGAHTAYAEMSRLCVDSAYPQSCYEGIGYITPIALGYDPALVRDACDSVGHTNGGNVYCRGMAALIFHISPSTRKISAAPCKGLSGRSHTVCLEYAAHDRDFSFSSAEVL